MRHTAHFQELPPLPESRAQREMAEATTPAKAALFWMGHVATDSLGALAGMLGVESSTVSRWRTQARADSGDEGAQTSVDKYQPPPAALCALRALAMLSRIAPVFLPYVATDEGALDALERTRGEGVTLDGRPTRYEQAMAERDRAIQRAAKLEGLVADIQSAANGDPSAGAHRTGAEAKLLAQIHELRQKGGPHGE